MMIISFYKIKKKVNELSWRVVALKIVKESIEGANYIYFISHKSFSAINCNISLAHAMSVWWNWNDRIHMRTILTRFFWFDLLLWREFSWMKKFSINMQTHMKILFLCIVVLLTLLLLTVTTIMHMGVKNIKI